MMPRLKLIALVALAMVMAVPPPASAEDQGATREWLDLAAIVVRPGDLPEPGFQERSGSYLAPFIADAHVETLEASGRTYVNSMALASDRAVVNAGPLATFETWILETGSENASVDWAENEAATGGIAFRQIGEMTWGFETEDQVGLITVNGNYAVRLRYFPMTGSSNRQNTGDWSLDALIGLRDVVNQRLEAARNTDGLRPGTAAVAIDSVGLEGPDVREVKRDQQYRVIDGEVQPGPGELEAPRLEEIATGATSVLANDHRVELGYGGPDYHDIRVTLATFGHEDDATRYGAMPGDTSRLGLPVDVTYGDAVDGLARGTVTTENGERGTAIRVIAVVETSAVIVEWFATGNATTTLQAARALIERQVACVKAPPEPCDVVPFASLAGQGEFDPNAASEGDIGSEQYGWSVDLPESDACEITQTEPNISGSDFVELRSDRSIARLESVIEHGNEAPDCVIGELELLQELEEHAVITLGSDDPGEWKAGSEDGHAWAICTVEPLEDVRVDQEYTIRFDCYTLIDSEVSLVMTFIAPRER